MINYYEFLIEYLFTKGLDALLNNKKLTWQLIRCLQAIDPEFLVIEELNYKEYRKRLYKTCSNFSQNPNAIYDSICIYLGRQITKAEFEVALKRFNYKATQYRELSDFLLLSHHSKIYLQEEFESENHFIESIKNFLLKTYTNRFFIMGSLSQGKHRLDRYHKTLINSETIVIMLFAKLSTSIETHVAIVESDTNCFELPFSGIVVLVAEIPQEIRPAIENRIYPNSSCPCGSGKKYKQCCGIRRLT